MTETSYCRLCAELTSENNSFILIDSIECNQNLVYKILEYFDIQIQQTDNLSKYICSECYKQVLNTYEFSEKIRQGQNTLSSLFYQIGLNKHINIKTESNESNDHLNEGEQKKVKVENSGTERDFVFQDVKNEPFSDEECETASNSSPTEKESTKSVNSLNLNSKIDVELQKLKEIEEWKKYIWTCNACETEFQSVQELRDHYEQVHNAPVQYTCMECSKVISIHKAFRKHVRRHWNKHKYQCDVCGKYFADRSHHEKHMVVHSEDRKFMCSTCGGSFKTQNTLNNHMRTHLPDDEKPKCDVCQKTFSIALYLTEHKKIHEGLKQYTCEQCGRTFTQKAGLDLHMICAHTGQTPLQCPHCPKVLKNEISFRRHQRQLHTDLKPHECKVCGKKFRLSCQLKEHSIMHSEKLPYECEHCKKGFRSNSFLKIHLRQHTGEKPYSCLECNHDFVNGSNFTKHLKRRHGFEKVSLVNQRQYPFTNTINK